MDTNSNIRAQKKIVSVEILHLDELGYGPQGRLTRREWRKECLANLLADKEVFEAWQDSWKDLIDGNSKLKSFECRLHYFDDLEMTVIQSEMFMGCALDFAGHIFEQDAFLNHFIFKQDTLFSGASFRGDSYFGGVVFEQNADFHGTVFNQVAFFERVKFHQFAYFAYATFNAIAFFQSSNFINSTDFERATFLQYADFHESTFKEIVSFKNTKIYGNGYFYKTVFSNNDAFIDFSGSEFFRYLNFYEANINSGIDFSKVVFHASVDFHETIFCDKSSFEKSKFLDKCIFINVIFKDFCDFENVYFENIGHFEGAKFLKRMPGFRGCKIDATRLEFSEISEFPNSDIEEGAIENVSFLKRLSDEHGQTDQALRFNAIELRLKRLSSNSDIGFKTVTWLYEKLSNYGRSFIRPIFWYIVLICLTAILAMTYSTYLDSPTNERQELCKQIKDQPPPLKLSYERAVVEYAMFRAGGLMDFTDTGKQNNAVNCRLFEEPIEPPLMRAWGIFKGIASIALLFLAALGLRNKYRIK